MEREQYPLVIRTIEAAEILGVSVVEARRLCRDGTIFAFKLGEEQAFDEWRVFTDSVFDYRAAQLSPSDETIPVGDGD